MGDTEYVWEAWIGKKIARAESLDGDCVIVLEDGRGLKFFGDGGAALPFVLKDIEGPLWPKKG